MNEHKKQMVVQQLKFHLSNTNFIIEKDLEIIRIYSDDSMINSIQMEHILHIKNEHQLRMFIISMDNIVQVCLR